MSIEEEQFKEHLRQVANATTKYDTSSDFKERPLTLDELKELAISMGLTEEGWDKLLVKAKKHLKSADDHLRARNFEEAIKQGEQAIAINPYIENGNAVLAKSYLMIWLENHNSADAEKAEYYARKELIVDPKDQVAVNVLSTINKKQKLLKKEGNSKNKILLVAGGVILIIVCFLFFSSSSTNNNTSKFIKNNLIEAEEDIYSKWDLVQVAISQRNNMIPDLFSAVKNPNTEVEILIKNIETLQSKIENTKGENRFKLENELSSALNEMKQLLRINGNQSTTQTLLIQIEGSENRIAFEKKKYNDAIKKYNILVKKNQDNFPSYETKPYFNEK